MSKPKRARYESVTVDVGYQRYSVLCRVIPAKPAPHVGADSPRFMEPGRPARAVIFSVTKGYVNVTPDVDLMLALEKAVAEKLGLTAVKAAQRETQGYLELEVGA